MTETSSDYYGDNFKRNSNESKSSENGSSNEHGGENQDSTLANQRANDYVKELLGEKLTLDHQKQPNCMRLIEQGNEVFYFNFLSKTFYYRGVQNTTTW